MTFPPFRIDQEAGVRLPRPICGRAAGPGSPVHKHFPASSEGKSVTGGQVNSYKVSAQLKVCPFQKWDNNLLNCLAVA